MLRRGTWSLAALPLLAACAQTAGGLPAHGAHAPVPTTPKAQPADVEGEAPAAGARPEQGPFKRHTVSVLTRVVSEERAEGGPAIGLDYEYRFHESWGAGLFAEYVAGELEVGVFGAMANHRPTERLLIGIGPGIETSSDETRALVRLGGLYEFEAGEIIVAPAIYLDWLEGGHQALLVGLNFGKKL